MNHLNLISSTSCYYLEFEGGWVDNQQVKSHCFYYYSRWGSYSDNIVRCPLTQYLCVEIYFIGNSEFISRKCQSILVCLVVPTWIRLCELLVCCQGSTEIIGQEDCIGEWSTWGEFLNRLGLKDCWEKDHEENDFYIYHWWFIIYYNNYLRCNRWCK